MRVFFSNQFTRYILKFGLSFCVLYLGTLAVIGVTAPGGYYSPFIDKYLNYIDGLRSLLMHTSKLVLRLLGYDAWLPTTTTIRVRGGLGVRIVYSCIGYGVMSFWIAFIYANQTGFIKKIKWIAAGLAIIFTINILRVTLLVIFINERWKTPFDNHTFFNVSAYMAILTMIYFFDKSQKKTEQQLQQKTTTV